jgi:hypothetical protein
MSGLLEFVKALQLGVVKFVEAGYEKRRPRFVLFEDGNCFHPLGHVGVVKREQDALEIGDREIGREIGDR